MLVRSNQIEAVLSGGTNNNWRLQADILYCINLSNSTVIICMNWMDQSKLKASTYSSINEFVRAFPEGNLPDTGWQ